MKRFFASVVLCAVILSLAFQTGPADATSSAPELMRTPASSAAQGPEPADETPAEHSRTGPIPPAEVVQRDELKQPAGIEAIQSQTVLSVPAYMWRHGCGPTAVGMVVAYYDGLGYGDLVPGDAATQTAAASQMIASGGSRGNPNPPGSEGHFEDYSLPLDGSTPLQQDAYLSAGRSPHTDDSVADFMNTSKSTQNLHYGWTWSNYVGTAFVDYVNLKNPVYTPSFKQYSIWGPLMTWNVLTTEIDSGLPLVFLVDSSGDGETDHFVTVIGYRTEPRFQYAMWDTWSTTKIRWENFVPMAAGVPWGIWGGWTFRLQPLFFSCADVTDVPESECLALEALYNSTGGTGWATRTNWLSGSTVGNWYGVEVREGHVAKLEVPANMLSGFIPSDLDDLPYLLSLDLSANKLSGRVPPEMGSLAELWLLDLSSNLLGGEIPPALGSLSKLEELYLDNNLLRGDLPAELADLSSLYLLNLGYNHLNVPAPDPPRTFIGNLDPDWHLTQTPHAIFLPLITR